METPVNRENPRKWIDAQWALYDMTFYELPRLEAFRRMVKHGLTRREAATLIQEHEREREA